MHYYHVVLQAKQKGINDGLKYNSEQQYCAGDLVTVPLRNTLVPAIVVCKTDEPEYETKSIQEVLAPQVLLPVHIAIAQYMSSYYLTPLRSTLACFLPSTTWSSFIPDAWLTICPEKILKQTKSLKSLLAISDRLPLPLQQIHRVTGVPKPTLQKYKEQKILSAVKQPLNVRKEHTYRLPNLTTEQLVIANAVSNTTKPHYIFGVTGSGKTEVYCHLIQSILEKNQQALVLLPEIFVTEHSKERYHRYFPSAKIIIWHSKMGARERKLAWHAIRSGEADIVIGSRSAMTMPFSSLGCIVLDEEHEWTYKQDTAPRYHTRTIAEHTAKMLNIPCILGSATPSLEAWHAMQTGTYQMHELPNRYGTAGLPEVRVIDLHAAYSGNYYPFSDDVITAIKATLARNEKVVLFLNKRGIASCLLCTKCKRRVISNVTQLPLSVHKNRSGALQLYDQFTQQYYTPPQSCPHCNSTELRTIGAGTHGIEELCQSLFPGTPLWRIDSDTLKASGNIEDVLERITTSGSGILLGTQAVVKGLDLPDVTLSVVLIADIGLSLPHFRASERVFQLLLQLSGRSGRHKPGQVYIQTFRPEAPEITAVKEHNARFFYQQEYALRKALQYPPFLPMIRILFRGKTAQADAKNYASIVKNAVESELKDCTVLTSPTFFGGGTVWQCLLKGVDARSIVERNLPQRGFIDIDPLETL